MGNIVSYFRARPGQAAAVEQTMLAREITEETREKQTDPDIIRQHEVGDALEIKLEEVEEAVEDIDDFAHKASERDKRDNTDKGNDSQTEEISCLIEVTIPCKIESIQPDEKYNQPIVETYLEANSIVIEDDIPETMNEMTKPEQNVMPLPISNSSSIEAINEEVEEVIGDFDVIQEDKIFDTEINKSETLVEVNNSQGEKMSCTIVQADPIPQTASLQYEEAQYVTSKTCSESVDHLVNTDMNCSSTDLETKSMCQKTLQETVKDKDTAEESVEARETLNKAVGSRETVHETEEDMEIEKNPEEVKKTAQETVEEKETVRETTQFKEQAQRVTDNDNTDIENIGSIENSDADLIDQVSNTNEIGQDSIDNLEMVNSVEMIVEDKEMVPETVKYNETVEDKKRVREIVEDNAPVNEMLDMETAKETFEYEETAEDKKTVKVTVVDYINGQEAAEDKETVKETIEEEEIVKDKDTEQGTLEDKERIQERADENETAPEILETAEDKATVQETVLDEEKVQETTPAKEQIKLSIDIESIGSVEDSEVELINQDSNDNLEKTNAVNNIDEDILKSDEKQDAEVNKMVPTGSVVLKNLLSDSASFDNKSV